MTYWMKRALYDAGEGEGAAGVGGGEPPAKTTPEPKTDPEPKPNSDPQPPKKSNDGVIPLTMHTEEVDRLKGALDKERKGGKETAAKLRETEKRLAELELKDKKTTAYNEALSNLGADYEITADKLPVVQELINDLPDSETLPEKIAKLLDTAKSAKPKARITGPFNPGTPPAAKEAGKTREELWNLAKTDKEALKKALRDQK